MQQVEYIMNNRTGIHKLIYLKAYIMHDLCVTYSAGKNNTKFISKTSSTKKQQEYVNTIGGHFQRCVYCHCNLS